jgi:phospho-N-acetylmuramoyl-pentapeptide-transferase
MVPVLIAGLIAMVAAVVIGPRFIDVIRTRDLGKQIRAGGPASNDVKQGQPTMVGLPILASAVIPFLALSQYTAEGLTVLFIVLACALIGFTDDYLKLRRRRSLGLSGRWKMVGLAVITVIAAVLLQESDSFTTSIYVPVVGWDLDLGILFYPFLFFVIAGTVNGANLSDGIDGLAAGTVVIMLLTFLAIAGIAWIRSGDPGARSETYLDIATLAAALIGGTIGFLWYNAFPAEVMMGDTGSFALGGAIAGFAVVTGHEIRLPLIASMFALEVIQPPLHAG